MLINSLYFIVPSCYPVLFTRIICQCMITILLLQRTHYFTVLSLNTQSLHAQFNDITLLIDDFLKHNCYVDVRLPSGRGGHRMMDANMSLNLILKGVQLQVFRTGSQWIIKTLIFIVLLMPLLYL